MSIKRQMRPTDNTSNPAIRSATRDYLRVLAREMPEGEFELPFRPLACGLIFMRCMKELFMEWEQKAGREPISWGKHR